MYISSRQESQKIPRRVNKILAVCTARCLLAITRIFIQAQCSRHSAVALLQFTQQFRRGYTAISFLKGSITFFALKLVKLPINSSLLNCEARKIPILDDFMGYVKKSCKYENL